MSTRRPRILIEHPSSMVLLDLADELERAGFDVTTCGGPHHLEGRRCPLVTDGTCDRADQADVILNALGAHHIEVYAAQRALLPRTPVCIELSDAGLDRIAALLSDVRRCGPLPTGSALVDRIREALGEPPDEVAG